MEYWKVPERSKACTLKLSASTTRRFGPSRRNSVGRLNSPWPSPCLPMVLQDVALHVEDEDLVAQGVGDINLLRRRVNRDPCRPLEVTLAALQAADGAHELSAGFKDKDHARIGIGDVDVVLGVDGDALRGAHGVLVFRLALDELVLLLREIEDVYARRARDR